MAEQLEQLLKGRAPISPCGPEAFRFAGKAVQAGALLITPDGIYKWSAGASAGREARLLEFLHANRRSAGDFLLLGTGGALVLPTVAFREAIEKSGLGLDVMDTAAACRTYNVLLAEGRLFTAALLAA